MSLTITKDGQTFDYQLIKMSLDVNFVPGTIFMSILFDVLKNGELNHRYEVIVNKDKIDCLRKSYMYLLQDLDVTMEVPLDIDQELLHG